MSNLAFVDKLKMHARAANARALSTVRCDATTSFRSSPGSFLVGMVSKTPAMAQLLRTDCSLELSDHELSGKELVANFVIPKLSGKELAEALAYQQLLGKESEKDSLTILGSKSLSLRTSSLEKKNFCFRVIQLMCLAFLSVLGPMIFDLHSFQQRELAAAYPYKIQSLHQQELVAAYSEQLKSLQQTELEASYSEGQMRASQLQLESSHKELVEHLAQLSHKDSAVQSFQLQSVFQNELSRSAFTADQSLQQRELEATYALTEQISLLASFPERELTADGAFNSLSFSPTRACFQLSAKGLADKSFELTTAQLCHQHLAERAYSSRSLHQLTLSMAQFNSQLQFQTGQFCRRMQTNTSLQLSIAQLCFMAQLPTGSIRACQLTTAQLCFNKIAWIRQLQNIASATADADTAPTQAGAYHTASAATALDRSSRAFTTRRTTRSLYNFQGELSGENQQTASTSTTFRTDQLQQDIHSTKKQNKKDSLQLVPSELEPYSLCFSNQLDRVQPQQPQSSNFILKEHFSFISFQLHCAALLSATLVAQSLASNSLHLPQKQLSNHKPHKGEPAAFPTRPSATASSTRSTKTAWRSRARTRAWSKRSSTTALGSRSAAAAFSTIALSTRSSPRAWRSVVRKTASRPTRASLSLMTTRLLLSFMLVFVMGIFTSNSIPPSFPTSNLITCWDLELEKPHEQITSFGKKELVEKEELTISCWERELENQHELHKSLLKKETLEHLKLQSAFGNTELGKHLADKPFQVQQLQN